MSYGTSLAEVYREVGAYAAKILNGATPSDLPVLQTDKIELVINLKTAERLGLTIPASFLSLADEAGRPFSAILRAMPDDAFTLRRKAKRAG